MTKTGTKRQGISPAQAGVLEWLNEKNSEVRKYTSASGGGQFVAYVEPDGDATLLPFAKSTFDALVRAGRLVLVAGPRRAGNMHYHRYLPAGFIKEPAVEASKGVPQYYRCARGECRQQMAWHALFRTNGGCMVCGGPVVPVNSYECRLMFERAERGEGPLPTSQAGDRLCLVTTDSGSKAGYVAGDNLTPDDTCAEPVDDGARREAIKDTLARLQHVRCELLRISHAGQKEWDMRVGTAKLLDSELWNRLMEVSDLITNETGVKLEAGDERRHAWYTDRFIPSSPGPAAAPDPAVELPRKQKWSEMDEAARAEFVRRFNEAPGEDGYYAVVGDADDPEDMARMEAYIPFSVFVRDGRLVLLDDAPGGGVVASAETEMPEDVTVSYERPDDVDVMGSFAARRYAESLRAKMAGRVFEYDGSQSDADSFITANLEGFVLGQWRELEALGVGEATSFGGGATPDLEVRRVQ